MKEMLE